MNESAISVRYAKALYQSAAESNLSKEVLLDMRSLESFSKEIPEFNLFIESPVITVSDKIKFFATITKEGFQDLTKRFLELITRNKRESYLPMIVRNFFRLYKQDQGIMEAVLVSAGTVKDDTLEKIRKMLQENYQATIEIEQKMNADLIGGFVLRIEDEQMDSSIAAQLKKIKRELNRSVLK